MLSGDNTTLDWQTHATDILVLPVGAFEQHSDHLPLATDRIQGDYFATAVAGALDAALLPAIAIATSMEHTGYRGSFSLRPETLMQIIRDIADDAARQHFRILIVINAHGGNHALVPVCRDINRRDGPLKIILVNYWEHGATKVTGGATRPGLDIHANATETSLMLNLRPDLVRPERADARYASEPQPLLQPDLTTFGVGHISPSGAVGWPSEGSAAQGRIIIDNLTTGLIAHLRDRISRLRVEPRYAGPGGLALRPLLPTDIADAMRLKVQAGWNQTEADWTLLLAAAPSGCFGMVHQGRVVGTVTTTPYGAVAWIGMVLVDAAFRNMGIATRLMNHALQHLQAVETVKLDATAAGREVYNRIGFIDAYALSRLTHPSAATLAREHRGVRTMTETDLPAVQDLDRTVFGADRGAILRAIWNRAADSGCVMERDGRIVGFGLSRAGSDFLHVGPLVAASPSDALILTRALLTAARGRPVLLDVPRPQPAFTALLVEAGFSEQRSFTRMFRGPNRTPGLTAHQFAVGGPEIG